MQYNEILAEVDNLVLTCEKSITLTSFSKETGKEETEI